MNAAFDNGELAIIDRVYELAWAQVEARDPKRDRTRDEERRATLKLRVANFVRSGQVEFDPLYRTVLATIPYHWSRNGNTT